MADTESDGAGQTTATAPLVEHVRSDPDLSPGEQETVIRWTGEDDRATIHTEERGVILSLLRSPVATVHTLRVSDDERFGATVPVDEYSEGDVTGVRASVPIGAVKVKSEARATDRRGAVVSDHQPTTGSGDSAGDGAW